VVGSLVAGNLTIGAFSLIVSDLSGIFRKNLKNEKQRKNIPGVLPTVIYRLNLKQGIRTAT
jgi:hypothetical protein